MIFDVCSMCDKISVSLLMIWTCPVGQLFCKSWLPKLSHNYSVLITRMAFGMQLYKNNALAYLKYYQLRLVEQVRTQSVWIGNISTLYIIYHIFIFTKHAKNT